MRYKRFKTFKVVQTVKEQALGTEVLSGLLIALMLLALTSCDRLPGKPTQEERWKPATEVTDFPNSTP